MSTETKPKKTSVALACDIHQALQLRKVRKPGAKIQELVDDVMREALAAELAEVKRLEAVPA